MTGVVKRVAVATVLGLGASLVIAAPASAAYPPSSIGPWYIRGGATAGTITWYERSVNIQGWVEDYASEAGSTQVSYSFYQNNTYLGRQTRTVTSRKIPINFVEEGPRGGITVIEVVVCSPVECSPLQQIGRPAAGS